MRLEATGDVFELLAREAGDDRVRLLDADVLEVAGEVARKVGGDLVHRHLEGPDLEPHAAHPSFTGLAPGRTGVKL